MDNRLFTIPYKKKLIEVCVTKDGGTNNTGYGVILTHGAGGDMHLSQLRLLAEYLASQGVMVVRFTCKGLNLAYRVKVYKHVLEHISALYKDISRYFLSGRSMGARAAVGVANDVKGTCLDHVVTGVIALSYPLHTKDDKSSLRDQPLHDLNKTVCLISGTEDEMCEKTLFENVLRNVESHEIKWIRGANHALKVKGTKEDDMITDVGNFIHEWCKIQISGTDETACSDDVKESKHCENELKRKPVDNGKRLFRKLAKTNQK